MKNTMFKAIAKIARDMDIQEWQIRTVIEKYMEEIEDTLMKGDEFMIQNFGTFGVRRRNSRPGVNIHTKEKFEIPPKAAPYFSPSGKLKDKIEEKINPDDVEFKRIR